MVEIKRTKEDIRIMKEIDKYIEKMTDLSRTNGIGYIYKNMVDTSSEMDKVSLALGITLDLCRIDMEAYELRTNISIDSLKRTFWKQLKATHHRNDIYSHLSGIRQYNMNLKPSRVGLNVSSALGGDRIGVLGMNPEMFSRPQATYDVLRRVLVFGENIKGSICNISEEYRIDSNDLHGFIGYASSRMIKDVEIKAKIIDVTKEYEIESSRIYKNNQHGESEYLDRTTMYHGLLVKQFKPVMGCRDMGVLVKMEPIYASKTMGVYVDLDVNSFKIISNDIGGYREINISYKYMTKDEIIEKYKSYTTFKQAK